MQQKLRGAIGKASSRHVVPAILLLILISGVVVGVRAWPAPVGLMTRGSSLAGAEPPSAQTEAVSVVLGPNKFTPVSVTRAAGPFRLEVSNQSGTQEVTLQLRRDNGGEIVQEWRVQSGTQALSEVVDLAHGGYNLSVAQNPACLFHITVQ
jgi:hypothetical protein